MKYTTECGRGDKSCQLPIIAAIRDDDKLGILDVKVGTKAGKVINIEIQVNPTKHIGRRLSFYKSKLIVGQVGKGERYDVIQRVICVCITKNPQPQ